MNPKKITIDALKAVFAELKAGKETAIGAYLYKSYHIQVSLYRSSGTERSAQLYKRRRQQGLCVRCGAKVTKKNPATKTLYRLCERHMKEIDRA